MYNTSQRQEEEISTHTHTHAHTSLTRICRLHICNTPTYLQHTYIPATHLLLHDLHTYIQPTLLHTLHPTHLHLQNQHTYTQPIPLHNTPTLSTLHPTYLPYPYTPAHPPYNAPTHNIFTLLVHTNPSLLQTLHPTLHTLPLQPTLLPTHHTYA